MLGNYGVSEGPVSAGPGVTTAFDFDTIAGYAIDLLGADTEVALMDGSTVIISHPMKRLWRASISIPSLDRSAGGKWTAFLALKSKLDHFIFSIPNYSPASGYGGDTPLVNGGTNLGKTLAADGVTNSTAIAKIGDYLTVNNEFKVLTADATSDGSGQVTFTFEPALRSSPPNNSPIDIHTPSIILRLMMESHEWGIRAGGRVDAIQIQAIENVDQ